MPEQAFLHKKIWAPEHPNHAEFRSILADPIFDDAIVSLGDVAMFRRPTEEISKTVAAAFGRR